MHNNDILIRLRYAMDIKETEMVDMFKAGGVALSRQDVKQRLIKPKEFGATQDVAVTSEAPTIELVECSDTELLYFLNGFIESKRGKQEPRPGQPAIVEKATPANINNLLLKKLKIALTLTSEDMLEIFSYAEVVVTKGELGALLRNEGHRNYKECGDKFTRKFLKGLSFKYRT